MWLVARRLTNKPRWLSSCWMLWSYCLTLFEVWVLILVTAYERGPGPNAYKIGAGNRPNNGYHIGNQGSNFFMDRSEMKWLQFGRVSSAGQIVSYVWWFGTFPAYLCDQLIFLYVQKNQCFYTCTINNFRLSNA